MRRVRAVATAVVAGLAVSGCAAGSGSATASKVTLRVFAAASLNQAVPAIAKEVFASAHPNVTVQFSYDGSSALVDQLKNGAPADVFASADAANMDKAVSARVAVNPTTFARNVLVMITPAGNPAHVTGLDASLDGKKLVVCAPQVPCGAAAVALEQRLGYNARPVSEEQKVTDVVAKVTAGEADAGLVYATDAQAAGAKITVVSVPGTDQIVNADRIATVTGTKQGELAQQFIAAVESPAGQQVLARYGFRDA